jgi:hypothetical protein
MFDLLRDVNHLAVLNTDLTAMLIYCLAWFWFRETAILVTACIYGFFVVVWHINF